MTLAKVLLQSAGLLPIDATEHDSPRHTRSGHPEAASSSGNSTPMLQSAASKYTGMTDPACDAVLGLLLWMSKGFSIHPEDKAAMATEVLIKKVTSNVDNSIDCTDNDMEMLEKVLNIMMVDREGSPKDPRKTLEFMRQCERARQAVIETKGRPATEQLHLDEGNVSACLRHFALDYLQNDLLPHQEDDQAYAIKWKDDGTWSFTSFQRSFINNMLRKNLGNSKVAFRIWELGLPKIASKSVQGATDECLLQSCMDDCFQWFVCLAKDIVKRTEHPDYQVQLDLSSLTPSDAQIRRREQLQQARHKLQDGKRLATFFHGKKRTYDEMSARDQHFWEDYDTGKCLKHVRAKQVKRLQPFRSSKE